MVKLYLHDVRLELGCYVQHVLELVGQLEETKVILKINKFETNLTFHQDINK